MFVCLFVFFRLRDFDEAAARVGVTGCSQEPRVYYYPRNPKLRFWDFPGMGTPSFQVQVDLYDVFLVFTDIRFRLNDSKLVEQISSIGKTFLFILTKIDQIVNWAEEWSKPPGSFNEEAVLEKIRAECLKNLGHLLSNPKDIFLISNRHPEKWDFERLEIAILDMLTRCQRETSTSSLGVVKSQTVGRW